VELDAIIECYRRGWFARIVAGAGWQPCSADAPGALPDLSRLAFLRQHGYDPNTETPGSPTAE
jgi:hypothetical protein